MGMMFGGSLGQVGIKVDPGSMRNLLNTLSLLGKDIGKAVEKASEDAAKEMKEKVQEAYASPSGKVALAEGGLNERTGRGPGDIPLYFTKVLHDSIIVRPSKQGKRSDHAWEVTMEPGVHHLNGLHKGVGATLLQVALYHEGGYTAILPGGRGTVPVPARPVWGPTHEKHSEQVYMKHVIHQLGKL